MIQYERLWYESNKEFSYLYLVSYFCFHFQFRWFFIFLFPWSTILHCTIVTNMHLISFVFCFFHHGTSEQNWLVLYPSFFIYYTLYLLHHVWYKSLFKHSKGYLIVIYKEINMIFVGGSYTAFSVYLFLGMIHCIKTSTTIRYIILIISPQGITL